MKKKSFIFLYLIVPIILFFIAGEIWVRSKHLVGQGLDRIPHPYISIGGFYKGGYFGTKTMDYKEAPENYGYERR
ncbi:MAG: hypothetical protein ACXWQQ_09540, partial [Pseudobdellovibrio sp.]